MKEAPASLAVIGGGVIGLEMASYFNSIGTKVTVIEMLDHIAGPTDSEISKILLRNYKAKGVEFLLGAKVTGVSAGKVAYELDGKQIEEFPFPAVLADAKPVMEYLPGWKCDIRGCTDYNALPENAKKYVDFLEAHIGHPITLVSTGPKRHEITHRATKL